MILNMIGEDQTIPGAGGRGATPFSMIEQADTLKAPGKSEGKPFSKIEQLDTFPQHNLDPKRVAERKELDEKQIEDAFKVLGDLAVSPPGWRDIYEAQKKRESLAETGTGLNPERVAQRKALDEKQILDAIQVFEDIGFVPNWRDIYEAQKKGKAYEGTAKKVDDILNLSKPVGDPTITSSWRD